MEREGGGGVVVGIEKRVEMRVKVMLRHTKRPLRTHVLSSRRRARLIYMAKPRGVALPHSTLYDGVKESNSRRNLSHSCRHS